MRCPSKKIKCVVNSLHITITGIFYSTSMAISYTFEMMYYKQAFVAVAYLWKIAPMASTEIAPLPKSYATHLFFTIRGWLVGHE